MKVSEIFEARRNPHLNPKSDFVAEFYYLYHKYRNSLYMTFTNINKLGVNPQSGFETPIGIYAYPAHYVKETLEHQDYNIKRLPFAGDRPYVQFLVSKGKELDLDQYNGEQLRKDLNSLFEHVYGLRMTRDGFNTLLSSNALEDSSKFVRPSLAEQLWTIIYLYATNYVSSVAVQLIENTLSEGSNRKFETNYLKRKPSINWNTILNRIMGYDYVVDDGNGIIHHNEETQAVFLNNKSYTHVGTYELGEKGAENTAFKYNSQFVEITKQIVLEVKKDFPDVNEHTKIPDLFMGNVRYTTIKDTVKTRYTNSNPPIESIIKGFRKLLVANEFTKEDLSKNGEIYSDNGFYFDDIFIKINYRVNMFIMDAIMDSFSDNLVKKLKQNKKFIMNQAHESITSITNISMEQLE